MDAVGNGICSNIFGKAMNAVAVVERVPSIICDTNTGMTSNENK